MSTEDELEKSGAAGEERRSWRAKAVFYLK
jgi:hypothetical protein